MNTVWNWIAKRFKNLPIAWERWQYRTFSPSNVLQIRNVPREWIDRDARLFHAAFTVLMDFVDNEMDGATGLQRYVVALRKNAQANANDVADQMSQQALDAYVKMLELYNWYASIDWQDPIQKSPAYAEMLEKIEYRTQPTEHGTFRMIEEGVDSQAIARERALHVVREQQFEKIKLQRLHELCNIHGFLWN